MSNHSTVGTRDQPATHHASNSIVVQGARENNLKNLCFEIPKGKFIALTGPSGSGKSSIAVEVLQMECLRQFLESLGMTTDHLAKPKVDKIIGLSPSIGVSQRVTDFNPRSTVGTKTGILSILRNLFASIGRQPCEGCGDWVSQGLQARDRVTTIEIEETGSASKKKRTKSYFSCPNCGQQLEKLKMAHFSTNSLDGACSVCRGVGEVIDVNIRRLLREDKCLTDGGVSYWDKALAEHYVRVIQAASKHYDFPFDTTVPIRDFSSKQRDFLLYGITFPEFVKAHKHRNAPKKVGDGKFEGVVPYLLSRYRSSSRKLPDAIKPYISRTPCDACSKARLGRLGREATVGGRTISEVTGLPLHDLLAWVGALENHVSPDERPVLETVMCALKERISNVIEVGLGYLTLDRPLPTLSAGESQRVRLACILGSGLTGVLYVLDEPTTGLHPHDTAKLLKTLRRIQETGNTVLVIEHDLDVIRAVDHIIDLGPGGGSKGGEIVASGTPEQVMATQASTTGRYLSCPAAQALSSPRPHDGRMLTVRGASEHNLKSVDVSIPINQFVAVTGVSGSGKSTFLFGILEKIARQHFYQASAEPGKYSAVHGLEHFDRLVTVDQVTIGNTRSSRSNVATYTKLFNLIRDLFALQPAAKIRGFGADAFSFNSSDERCDNCSGAGVVMVDMAFMPDVEMECPVCSGMRFSDELLSVTFNGLSIADVLNLTVGDAIAVFRDLPAIVSILDLMQQVGLDYLSLGQSSSTLSGGEAQRIKLARELSKSGRESTLYLLDEPTAGLHRREVEMLLDILDRLVARGHTVVAIEHNLDAISRADTVIDFGPGGGTAGGEIVATGSPEQLAANEDSLTGGAIRAYYSQA